MKPESELIWLVLTKGFADLLLPVVTPVLTERAARTVLLVLYVFTGPRHLADCGVHVSC
jgi:hypothetical protein